MDLKKELEVREVFEMSVAKCTCPRLERCSGTEQSMFPLFRPDEGPEPGVSRQMLLCSSYMSSTGSERNLPHGVTEQGQHTQRLAKLAVQWAPRPRAGEGCPRAAPALSGRQELVICSFIQQVFVEHRLRPTYFSRPCS